MARLPRRIPLRRHQANRREIGRGEICCCATGSGEICRYEVCCGATGRHEICCYETWCLESGGQTRVRRSRCADDRRGEIHYALGLSVYKSLGQFDLSPHEFEILKRALADAAAHKPAVDLNEWDRKSARLPGTLGARNRTAESCRQGLPGKGRGRTRRRPGRVRLDYREVKMGSGNSPKATDTVKVNYRGTLVDGTEFDSSFRRNQPAQFALNGVIGCWTEGLQKMKAGGKAVLICPSDLAYGDKGRPGIPGGATLIFELELLEIVGAAK